MDALTKTEQALARIFAYCDNVAETGETLLTEDESENAARLWLGLNFNQENAVISHGGSAKD